MATGRAGLRAGRATIQAIMAWVRAVAAVAQRVAADRRARRFGMGTSILAVSFAGVVIGVLLGARVNADVGPFRAELSLTPSLTGDTQVVIPPLGALRLNSHDGPAHLNVQLGALDQGRSEALVNNPNGFALAGQHAVEEVARGVILLATRTLGVALLATLLLAALIFRNMRRVAWSGALALIITAGSLAAAVGTFRPNSIEEPRYEGLLINAPAVVGDARQIADRYAEYSAQLQRLVGNVTRLYSAVSTLPVYEPDPSTIKVLHISDMHLNPAAWSVVRTVVQQSKIDMVIDTGDLVDWGTTTETSYVSSIGLLDVPYVFIRGNHDSPAIAAAVAKQHNAIVLENTVKTVKGLTIAGIGDPRFTPDKEASPTGSGDTPEIQQRVTGVGQQLATTIRDFNVQAPTTPVNIAMVHDPASAGGLSGAVPIVLAGHLHKREVSLLPRPADAPAKAPNTLLMVQGSTGGAGLRGLEAATPLPLDMSVLYFDKAHTLQAYDDISVGGTGLAQVNLERHLVDHNAKPATASASPTSSASPSR